MNETTYGEITAQFLIAEYTSLQQRANSYEEIKSKRVNFFLVIIAAVWASFSAFVEKDIISTHLDGAILVISIFCLTLGILTLRMLISYSIAIVVFHRRAARIRRWFVDKNKELIKHVAFEANDDRPTFIMPYDILYWRGAESTLLLINSVLSGCFTVSLLYHPNINLFLLISSIIISCVLSWYLQIKFTQYKLKEAETSRWALDNINFPTISEELI
ncbi:MAG: hypothetical protein D3921_10320 [Candidatus Electrothrix sp. AW1]|jgi:uncharacterized membrane protein|nr:hypothetical protein [Candidatus Electrothrix sp. AX1]MCI5182885.1 hypothetical protein [Candidatus Electrothrix gigas]